MDKPKLCATCAPKHPDDWCKSCDSAVLRWWAFGVGLLGSRFAAIFGAPIPHRNRTGIRTRTSLRYDSEHPDMPKRIQ